ncbi:3'(2'),5'-bisphosphate nucleotidase CysQ [Georgenia halophila]|uniref:3'(2'),5-bisphosphonucleoside 3'(2')-phosphohydrolase n=1 Tax=Georgenia halophila TaxID=620889 RepID=A0ABP8KTR8_9MICO
MPDDHSFAADLATSAGQVLLNTRSEVVASGTAGGKALAKMGDATAQEHIAARLAAERPDDAVLSEEAADDPVRLSRERVWIIDPLDGTREYSEDRHDWAVHVALWECGALTAGAVALPGLNATLSTAGPFSGLGAPAEPVRLAVSRSRASDLVLTVAERIGAELVPMGSAGYKVSAVVRGEVDAYIHSGGQYEWDSAAPVAVAAAAGLHTSRIDGSSLEYNRKDPYLPDLLVCGPRLADKLLRVLASI